MKKITVILLILTLLFAFAACKKDDAAVTTAPASQLENVPEKFNGSSEAEVKLNDIKIVIQQYNFSIEDVEFTFAQFKKNEKLSTDLGKKELDVYVKDQKLQKCEISEKNEYGNLTFTVSYSAEGKATGAQKNEYDNRGLLTQSMLFDKNGKLSGFYSYEYNEKYRISKRYEYSADRSFKGAESYVYNADGKLEKTCKYDASGKLIK